jgi:hypothetical protein
MRFQQAFYRQSISSVGDSSTYSESNTCHVYHNTTTAAERQDHTTDNRQSRCNEPTSSWPLTSKKIPKKATGNRRTADTNNSPDSNSGLCHSGKKADLIKSGKCSSNECRSERPTG